MGDTRPHVLRTVVQQPDGDLHVYGWYSLPELVDDGCIVMDHRTIRMEPSVVNQQWQVIFKRHSDNPNAWTTHFNGCNVPGFQVGKLPYGTHPEFNVTFNNGKLAFTPLGQKEVTNEWTKTTQVDAKIVSGHYRDYNHLPTPENGFPNTIHGSRVSRDIPI